MANKCCSTPSNCLRHTQTYSSLPSLQAIATAQAIAARLSAQAAGTPAAPMATPSTSWVGQPDYYQPSPTDALAAAQAIADRLAAAAPSEATATAAQQEWYQEAAPVMTSSAASVDTAAAAAQAIADKLAAQFAPPPGHGQQSVAVQPAASGPAPTINAAAAAAQAIADRLSAQASMPLGQPGYDVPASVDRSRQRKKWDAQ